MLIKNAAVTPETTADVTVTAFDADNEMLVRDLWDTFEVNVIRVMG
jgi:hypothetical protein